MEPTAAGGDPTPSPSGGASPPPPPPLGGWLAGIVSGAGRLLTAVLGPDSSTSGSTTTAASDGDSPSASSSPRSPRPPRAHSDGYIGSAGDHGNSPLFQPQKNMLNQGEKEAIMKDYDEGSLAIVSEIGPKDAIIQLLMQETYSRYECSTLIKIIQDRVVNSDSDDAVTELALPINWKDGVQATVGHPSFNQNLSLSAISTLPIHGHGFDNSASLGTAPTLTPTDKIQSVLKRSYSVSGDIPTDLRRVRPKINVNQLNISNFKQIDVIRKHPGDEKKPSLDVPPLGTNNLTYSNNISKPESAEQILGVPNKPSAITSQPFDSNSSQAVGDQKSYNSTIFDSCSNKDLKNGFPLKVETADVLIPFEQKMVDLSQQKHKLAQCDDSYSVSKLMLKEDIEAAPSLPKGVQLRNGSVNRRRNQSNLQKTTKRSPAKGSRCKNNDVIVKSENDLLEQTKLELEQDPDWTYSPVKRPVGRPRKAK